MNQPNRSDGLYLCGVEPGEPDLQSGVDVGEERHVHPTLLLHTGQQCFHGDKECGGVGILVVLDHELCRNLERERNVRNVWNVRNIMVCRAAGLAPGLLSQYLLSGNPSL